MRWVNSASLPKLTSEGVSVLRGAPKAARPSPSDRAEDGKSGMRFLGVSTVVLLAFAASSAHAADATAKLEITGHVSPRCSLAFEQSTVSHVLTDGPGSDDVPFAVDCNQRLVVNLKSLNGGLAHEARSRLMPSPGFISLLPYTATFQVDAAGASPIAFRSEQMLTGATGSIGVTPYKAHGRLVLSWSPSAPLIGGAYSDVIEVRVSGSGETSSSSTGSAG